MNDESIQDQQLPDVPEESLWTARPAAAESTPTAMIAHVEPSRSSREFVITILVIVLVGVNAIVLYITNSRITDLEVRLAALSSSVDSRGARPAPPARSSGPDPEKVYTLNTEDAPVRGSTSAPVTIVVVSDFQCPYCAKVRPTLEQVRDLYKDQVQLVWKHLPLESIHQNAMAAAIASEAAKNQGKFWEYHDKLFANQSKLSAGDLKQYATELGMDTTKFEADIADPATKKRVTDDAAEVNALGVTGTPGFFINGHFLNGAQPLDAFVGAINSELKRLNLPTPSQ